MASEASGSSLTSGNFDEFNSNLQANALKTTKLSLALPSDVVFHRSMDSEFAKDVDNISSRVLSLTNRVIALIATADKSMSRAKGKAKLESQDDVIDNFHSLVVDSVDQLLERTDICLDEFLGRISAPAIAFKPISTTPAKKSAPRGHIDPVIQHASHLPKPQLLFKRKVENNDWPWYPSLPHKYNAQVPLGYDYRDLDLTSSELITLHPYRYEIAHISYPERMFRSTVTVPPKDFEDTPFHWISTAEDFRSMLAKLRQSTEIAVDLEHHSYRSYAGFLCLMQISTREEDWVIDTLILRDELTELNEVFTNPEIVKVFHGAESDIVWLQQDFNVFIVNLFDTFHASKALDFPRHGLANLLEMYCDFTPDKRYQLADWRIRPLPKEMLEYARSDTHFLLYIYDNLRNALLDRAQSRAQSRSHSHSPSGSPPPAASNTSHVLIKQVLARSEETSLRTYAKEVYDEQGGSGSNGWDTLARKWNKGALLAGGPSVGVSALHRAVYQAVHKWREMVAREDDESTRYVLSNHFLFQLAEQPPADMAALLGIFHSVPPIIRKRAKELLEVIRDCAKRHLSNDSTSSVPPATPEAVSTPEFTNIPTQSHAKLIETSLSSLWARTPNLASAVASSSSLLFGSTLSAVRRTSTPSSQLSTGSSSLFGTSGIFPSQLPSNENPHLNLHFHDIVARINSTLVVGPTVPKAPEQSGESVSEEAPVQSAITEVSGMQVEIPFVPASQRKIVHAVEDSIVVVGQARQKKRKRTKPAPDGAPLPSAEGSKPKNKPQNEGDIGAQGEQDDHEPFDFTSVPNILDENPNMEDAKQKKRQKKQKSGGNFYGDFPAPPKAHSELKRGNQSYTFK